MPSIDLYNHLGYFQSDTLEEIRESLQNINQTRTPNHYIGEYAVFELLGTGAFGSVYKVRRRTARQSFLAMKEVFLCFYDNKIYDFFIIK